MKYMLKKIIIGVAIGTALMYIKTTNVFASSYAIDGSNVSTISMSYKFDVCLYESGNLLCQEAINDTTSIGTTRQDIYTTKSNEFLMLKEFSYAIQFSSTTNLSNDIGLPSSLRFFTQQGGSVPSADNIFKIPNAPSNFDYSSMSLTKYNNSSNFAFSNFLYDVSYEDTNGNLHNCSDLGIYITDSGNNKVMSNMVNECSFNSMKTLFVTFRPTSTYNGSIYDIFTWNNYPLLSGTPSERIQQLNPTYLLIVPPNMSLRTQQKVNMGSITYGTSINYSYPPAYNPVSVSINESMAELNKEIIMQQFVIGPSNANNEDLDKFNTDYSGLANGISDLMNNGNNGNFTTFLNSTVGLPVYYLNQSANTDLGAGLCYSQQYQEVHHGFIRLWKFSSLHNQDYLEFQLPCLIRDYYPYLKDKGNNYTMLGNSGTSFQYWWLIIQHGILYYFLVLTCLNVFKYTISNSKAEFEVFEL